MPDFLKNKSQQLVSSSGVRGRPFTGRGPAVIYFPSGKNFYCGYKSRTHRQINANLRMNGWKNGEAGKKFAEII